MIRMITIFIDKMIMMMCNAILTPFPLSISSATDVDDHIASGESSCYWCTM